MLNPTPEQASIFAAVAAAQRNLIISACAGGGKTSTIVESLKTLPVRDPDTLMPPSIVFLAFNKSIAETLKARCPSHVNCATFHSLGYSALRRSGILPKTSKVDGSKCRKLVFNAIGRTDDTDNVIRLVSLLKSRPQEPTAGLCEELCLLHDLTFEDRGTAFRAAVSVVNASTRDLSLIDFDDMLYLPVILDVSFDPMDWVFVDEFQDTNDIQLEILGRLQKPWISDQPDEQYSPTRYIFVGDPAQAIYGFRGANSDAMTKGATRFGCTSMPLSVSFRCPKAVVAEAQKALAMDFSR